MSLLSLTQLFPTQEMYFKNQIFILLCIASLFVLASCKFNKLETSNGDALLQGKWTEDTLTNKGQLVSYQRFDFTFTCDSFYAVIHNFSKVDLQGGQCYSKGTWKEYAKGYYNVVSDSLKFDGNFVDAEFKYKTQGSCYRSGKFTDSFLINSKADSLIVLRSLQAGTTHKLLLKEKSSCK